jgi:Fe-S-cluster containining protein
MGPIKDADEFIQRLSDKMGRKFQREDALVDFEEGRKLFPERSVWQDPSNFPAMRIDISKAKLPCVFYNTHAKFCSIHEVRPKTCQDYFCGYLMDEIGMERNTEEKKAGVPKNTSDPFST